MIIKCFCDNCKKEVDPKEVEEIKIPVPVEKWVTGGIGNVPLAHFSNEWEVIPQDWCKECVADLYKIITLIPIAKEILK